MNVHMLRHLPDCVEQWGPLWAYSCFHFENINGVLKKLFHGTRDMSKQEINGDTYHSRKYQRVLKRNSYTVAYRGLTGAKEFAFIEYFVHIQQRTIAILASLVPIQTNCTDHFQLSTSVLDTAGYISPVERETATKVCYVEDIMSKCLFLELPSFHYVVEFPTTVQFD